MAHLLFVHFNRCFSCLLKLPIYCAQWWIHNIYHINVLLHFQYSEIYKTQKNIVQSINLMCVYVRIFKMLLTIYQQLSQEPVLMLWLPSSPSSHFWRGDNGNTNVVSFVLKKQESTDKVLKPRQNINKATKNYFWAYLLFS